MRLENIVIDAAEPAVLGAFWRDAVGAQTLTWTPELVELRLDVPAGPEIDLCLPRVTGIDNSAPRAHLDLTGGADKEAVVERLCGLGARPLDIGQGRVPWTVLADPEGNPFCVLEFRPEYADAGPLAGVPMDSADPDRDARFWGALTGWEGCDGAVPSLRHPSGRGPRLEFCPELEPKTRKNHLHLDVRTPEGMTLGEATSLALTLGAWEVDHEWDVPWTILEDPSGNEFCILPPSES